MFWLFDPQYNNNTLNIHTRIRNSRYSTHYCALLGHERSVMYFNTENVFQVVEVICSRSELKIIFLLNGVNSFMTFNHDVQSFRTISVTKILNWWYFGVFLIDKKSNYWYPIDLQYFHAYHNVSIINTCHSNFYILIYKFSTRKMGRLIESKKF